MDIVEEANKSPTERPYRVTVLYADFGKRKTTTACSMVQDRGLLISSDNSWHTLLNPRHSEVYKKINVINYEGLSQIKHIDYEGYDTVIWDTFSHSVDMYIDLLYDEADWGGRYREKITTKNKELKDLEILAPVDYRVTRDIFRPTLGHLFSLSTNLIFTSQVNEPLKGLTPSMTLKPAIPNSTFKIIARMADIIGYIKPDRGNFKICMRNDTLEYLGKSRVEGLEGVMDLDSFVTKYKEIAF